MLACLTLLTRIINPFIEIDLGEHNSQFSWPKSCGFLSSKNTQCMSLEGILSYTISHKSTSMWNYQGHLLNNSLGFCFWEAVVFGNEERCYTLKVSSLCLVLFYESEVIMDYLFLTFAVLWWFYF